MSRWTIYKQIGEEDDAIDGPDTPPEGIVVEAPQFTGDELADLADGMRVLVMLSPGTLDDQIRRQQLRTRVLELAFMEVSRDA